MKTYLALLTSKDPKKVLMGPGSWSVHIGGMQRLTDLVPRVAHKYLDEREKMRACYHAGVAARGADAATRGVRDGGKSPTKTELKELYKREREEVVEQRTEMHEELVQEQTQHKRAKHALRSANSRAMILRNNLRACLHRERDKAKARGAGDLLASRNAAHALLKVYLKELVELRRWKTSRAAKSDPAELRKLEEKLAELRRENKALCAKRDELGKQKIQNDVDFAEAKQFAESIWLPQRQVGKGAGRGCAHDPLVRKLYMKLLTLRVSPSIMNEVSVAYRGPRARVGPRARAGAGRTRARRAGPRAGAAARAPGRPRACAGAGRARTGPRVARVYLTPRRAFASGVLIDCRRDTWREVPRGHESEPPDAQHYP